MARRKKAAPPAEADDSEDWMVTYADAITLLMAFFVMLVSFSKVDLPMFEDVQAGIAEKIGGVTERETPIFTLESKMRDILSESSVLPPEAVEVSFDDQGVVIDFAAGYFFEPGTIKLLPGTQDVLGGVYRQLLEPPYDVFKIDVEGHTSDLPPPANSAFPTNWELSASQAARVLRVFLELGMRPEWLKASGYADTQPKVPNKDIVNTPLPQNQKKNERVSLRLHP
ncbi:flagellar motor protein MotB [Rhodospirillaceae bacterium KN72]|uniref:Flagellar motor protein MotB n=1 Tax=Pacificispira spongiicola TaxID=2729598 RepID=A0A7Y0E0T5_9PROT|nr:flagellar motor protein MotB [Pacificispira spongiicola]NMM45154.1 flagellar motor protein MotB [Pacificispira spongiicola]